MEITGILGMIGAAVSVITLVAVGWRERRESIVRAEQRAKTIIDLLRIAENGSEPDTVREFARWELRRMRAELQQNTDHDSLIDTVFGGEPLAAANERLADVEIEITEPLDPDIARLISIIRWRMESGMTRQQEWQARTIMMIGMFVLGFGAIAVAAIQRALHP